MTQAISRSDFWMEVLPAAFPPAVSDKVVAFPGSAIAQSLNSPQILRLFPGKRTELKIRVKNLGDTPLLLWFTVKAYPEFGCTYEYDAEAQIESNGYQDLVIAFEVQPDYFETEFLFASSHVYECELSACEIEHGVQKLAHSLLFNLQVCPRTTYLDFLPAVYGELDFFSRLLAIFEHTFDPYIQTIDTLWAYLDPLTAPQSLLPFLAHWVGWELEPDLEVRIQRRLIRNAIEIYRLRGTREGLQLCLHLYTDFPLEQIQINTAYGQGMTLGQSQLGSETALGGGCPFHFTVHFVLDAKHSDYNRDLVERVIEREKPPFCTHQLL